MKKGGLYLLIFGLLLIILSSVFTYNIYSKTRIDDFEFKITEEADQQKRREESSGWSKLMSEKEGIKDYYPASEIILSWDLVEADKKRDTLYKITFDKLDKYQYFCLLQVLNNNKIKRTIEKIDDTYRIYLSLYSKSAAEVLLKELKDYDIEGRISKYKSEIKY